MNSKFLLLLLVSILSFLIHLTVSNESISCIDKERCGECLSANPDCHWCADERYTKSRCDNKFNLTSNNCIEIIGFDGEIEMIRSLRLRYPDNVSDPNPLQMNPKNVTLRMRPNSEASFIVTVYQVVYQDAFTVKIIDDLKNDSKIKLSYESSCVLDKFEKNNQCESVAFRHTVHFNVTIKTSSCPVKRNERKESFTIKPIGFYAQLSVVIEYICECECEKLSKKEMNSSRCSYKGSFECGICNCNLHQFGDQCQCDNQIENFGCFRGNETYVCSSRGECVCGICKCLERPYKEELIYGKYCECDNFSCPISNSMICGGPDHGMCDCGVCICHNNWKGDACEIKP